MALGLRCGACTLGIVPDREQSTSHCYHRIISAKDTRGLRLRDNPPNCDIEVWGGQHINKIVFSLCRDGEIQSLYCFLPNRAMQICRRGMGSLYFRGYISSWPCLKGWTKNCLHCLRIPTMSNHGDYSFINFTFASKKCDMYSARCCTTHATRSESRRMPDY
jgi:hypothetical protein